MLEASARGERRSSCSWIRIKKFGGMEVLRRIQAGAHTACSSASWLEARGGLQPCHGRVRRQAVAVEKATAAIEFLIRGLRWAVQRFEESLPR